jgi:hypothetical protein
MTATPGQAELLPIQKLRFRPIRTISVTARSRSRFARLRVRYPQDYRGDRHYDAELAHELLARTSELPQSKHDLEVVLTEYRYALGDLITALVAKPAPATSPTGDDD